MEIDANNNKKLLTGFPLLQRSSPVEKAAVSHSFQLPFRFVPGVNGSDFDGFVEKLSWRQDIHDIWQDLKTTGYTNILILHLGTDTKICAYFTGVII